MVKKLPLDDFLKTFKYALRIAFSLLIKNGKGEILMTKRANPPEKDTWHLPGSFLMKGEMIEECLLRVAREELGIKINTKNARLLYINEDLHKDPRGHVIDMIYTLNTKISNLKPTNYSLEIKFFRRLPENIGFNHKEVLGKLGFK